MSLSNQFYTYLRIAFCCIAFSVVATAQTVSLRYAEEPLNEILLDLNERYSVQVSINSTLSGNCLLSVEKDFASVDLALAFLAESCGLVLQKISDVYTFRAKSGEKEKPAATAPLPAQPAYFLFQGTIASAETGEILPFASVSMGGAFLVANQNGQFSFRSANRQETVVVRHLGYATKDTLLQHGQTLTVSLNINSVELAEVVVNSANREAITHVGETAGSLSFNNVSNSVVPGNHNNLIFNNLRLYPGIMAAGESITDYVIWGSFSGENHVIYDHITLFNSWGINDDIGRVNPLMIKHMEVFKGGYGVPYGDRIGGVILLNSRTGNHYQPEVNLSVNNQIANAYFSVPLAVGRSRLQVAVRKVYPEVLGLTKEPETKNNFIVPTYDYQDINLKFSTAFSEANQLEVSFIGSRDAYRGAFKLRPAQPRALVEDVQLSSKQWGASIHYAASLKNGGLASFTLSASRYFPDITSIYNAPVAVNDDELEEVKSNSLSNHIKEWRSRFSYQFPARRSHQVQLTAELVRNETLITSTDEKRFSQNVQRLSRFSGFLNDRWQVSVRWQIEAGLKLDVPLSASSVYVQPRIATKYTLAPQWHLHAAWGKYQQFIARNSTFDAFGNQTDIWEIADGNKKPVLGSYHQVAGVSYRSAFFEVNLEGYYKTSTGFSRYFFTKGARALSEGETRSMGVDLFVKKYLKEHQVFLSYSLGKVQERFVNGQNPAYRLSPQSQEHELKGGVILNFNPWHISLTHVYGSGFPNRIAGSKEVHYTPYSRTDVALQYRFSIQKIAFESGCSILNLFNQKNIRLNQSVIVTAGETINTLGVPFSPTVYLNARF